MNGAPKGRRVAAVLAASLVLMAAVEAVLVPNDHPVFPWHHVPGYAAAIGLAGGVAAVLFSHWLGRALRRPAPPEGE